MAARTQLTVYPTSREIFLTDTLAPSVAGDATNFMICNNDGGTYLEVVNTDGGASHAFTVLVARNVDTDLGVTARSFTAPASARGRTGIFPVDIYGAQLLINPTSALLFFQAFSAIQ